ncbi:MAG TPA: malto-oligosyltrehalose synthase [Streptosporangiaceae bacterium]|nr:malto-oligosyltrehalose synthase [Streptosporangiaceae bacterium]
MSEDDPGGRPPGTPVSTYRLQLQPGFGFADAAASADYLADLGVTHVYLSPILQATPGSTHGYDVVDHSLVSEELGGEAAFRDMTGRFRDLGLGVIVDIVPNHMAVPVPESLNRPLWSVLRDGAGSPFAAWFDVDWAAQDGRLLMPVLGGPVSDCLGDLKLDPRGAEPVLRYAGHVLPVRPGTARLPLMDLLDAQHYRLADWHLAATELNWRRFFDISSLIAVRVEDPEVFEATHEVILRLVAEGLIDGLRVDHPDGLADPRGYLRRLADRTGGLWVSTEKILSGHEELPADWPCAGTTGYDALGVVGGLFLDTAGAEPLTAAYQRLTAGPGGFAGVAEDAKREEADQALAAEVSRLARLAGEAGHPDLGGLSVSDRTAVLVELLTAMPVYRAYVVPGELAPPESAVTLARAAGAARARLPEWLHPALAAVVDLVLGRGAAGGAHARLIVAFQQVCGPVMAKGVEDTAFYRWSRLVALDEVGGDPDAFGTSPGEFHEFAARLARDWPASMTTLSTHDTKRQEDVRARLLVLAEIPEAWAAEVVRWHDRAAALASGAVPEPDTEYLMWQTLAGAWPLDRDRLTGYLRKAMREAKTRTSWTDPDPEYESQVLTFAELVLEDEELTGQIGRFVTGLAGDAGANALGAKLVQLTMPGVADTYQGCELAGLRLVDPDNRAPADFARGRDLLAALDAGDEPPGLDPGQLDTAKLLVTALALRLRRAHPDWFAGEYTPLAPEGTAARHAVGFARGGNAVTVVTRLPAGLRRGGGWAGTALPLPHAGPWRDLLTGASHAVARPLLSDVLHSHPVALLVPETHR